MANWRQTEAPRNSPASGEGQVVARLDPESSVGGGQEVDLWVDTTKLHFFHPEGGRNLAA